MAFDIYEWSIRAYLRFVTWRRGEKVGTDSLGNIYYRDKRTAGKKRERRWVVFAGESEASSVAPEWHGWLHHQYKDPPTVPYRFRQPWQKEHEPNPTGTPDAYFPQGHTLKGGERAKSTGDYEPWVPS